MVKIRFSYYLMATNSLRQENVGEQELKKIKK